MTLFSRLRSSPFALPLAALAALAMLFISETSNWRSRDAMDTLNELNLARVRVQRLLISVTDAETAQRGYLLTGRKEYLEPYKNAIETVPPLLERLRQHYAKRGDHMPMMAQIEELVAAKLTELANTMRLYDEGKHDAWRSIVLTNIGKDRMDAIRTTAEQMLADEARDSEVARKDVYDTLTVNRLGVGAMTALSLLALYMYLRQTRRLDEQRRQQQRAVQAERDQLGVEVKRRTAELTELSHHLLTVREDERSHLARELHDELGALLTAAKLDTARIKSRIGSSSPEAAERIAHQNETLNSGIALKRRIIEDLRPSSLNNLGLVTALENLVRDFEQRNEMKVECSLQAVALRPESELTVYRLIQEALTNISKYAKAKQVRISLGAQGNAAVVAVADDGVGFDTTQANVSAHGLLGMRYRVEAEGGTLTLKSAPGRGTRVGATLPLATPA